MYEENQTPLPSGDGSQVFADLIKKWAHRDRVANHQVTPENVIQFGDRPTLDVLYSISRRLLLPGSRIEGCERLQELANLAISGRACILCLTHRSNLDVPTLYTLLVDQADESVFHRIIWIAGRKLSEDTGLTPILIRGVNRLVITPRTWFKSHPKHELDEARRINRAAHKVMLGLRHQGRIFGLFPSGTRIRATEEKTKHAIEETDSFVKSFDYLLLGHIQGCTLPVTKDRDFTHEIPRLDRMIYRFGEVQETRQWRNMAADRYPSLDQRSATSQAIMEDIDRLAPAS